jgi:hypothetical protein
MTFVPSFLFFFFFLPFRLPLSSFLPSFLPALPHQSGEHPVHSIFLKRENDDPVKARAAQNAFLRACHEIINHIITSSSSSRCSRAVTGKMNFSNVVDLQSDSDWEDLCSPSPVKSEGLLLFGSVKEEKKTDADLAEAARDLFDPIEPLELIPRKAVNCPMPCVQSRMGVCVGLHRSVNAASKQLLADQDFLNPDKLKGTAIRAKTREAMTSGIPFAGHQWGSALPDVEPPTNAVASEDDDAFTSSAQSPATRR